MATKHIIINPEVVSIEIIATLCGHCDNIHYASSISMHVFPEEGEQITHTVYTSVYTSDIDEAIADTLNAANVLYRDKLDDEILVISEKDEDEQSISISEWMLTNLIPKGSTIN